MRLDFEIPSRLVALSFVRMVAWEWEKEMIIVQEAGRSKEIDHCRAILIRIIQHFVEDFHADISFEAILISEFVNARSRPARVPAFTRLTHFPIKSNPGQ